MSAVSASGEGLARCPICEQLHRVGPIPIDARVSCARCGSSMGLRKSQSISRAWAFLIAAYVLYIPANLYPVMYVGRLGSVEGDTIISGVQAMFAAGWLKLNGALRAAKSKPAEAPC